MSRFRFVPLVLLHALGILATADDRTTPTEDLDAERKEFLLGLYQEAAEAYEIMLTDSEAALTLRAEPVFQWLNTARVGTPRVQHGSAYVWTHNGRAEVLGTIFSQAIGDSDPYFYHEFHSLSTGRLAATRDGALHWNPAQAGIERRTFPEAPVPAKNARLRLVQMRSLARRFSGYSINYDDTRWDLRLLPESLYRMPKSRTDLLDSAVFTLVSTAGTDPEVLVLLEAPVTEGEASWHYAVCRFTDLKSWVSLDDKIVWAFENGSQGASVDAGPTNRYRFSTEGSVALP